MSARIKFCGINTEAALQSALRVGCDFVGFVHFEKSPRHLSLAEIATLRRAVPEAVKSVVVTVNPSDALLAEIAAQVAPDYVQLHSEESPARIAEIKAKHTLGVIKVFSVSDAKDVANSAAYADADYFMLDAKSAPDAAMPGGHGKSFDWQILQNVKLSKPWFLAGGLHAQNVGAALRKTHAPMVDVSSGIESAPGVKDEHKMVAFKEAVQTASKA